MGLPASPLNHSSRAGLQSGRGWAGDRDMVREWDGLKTGERRATNTVAVAHQDEARGGDGAHACDSGDRVSGQADRAGRARQREKQKRSHKNLS